MEEFEAAEDEASDEDGFAVGLSVMRKSLKGRSEVLAERQRICPCQKSSSEGSLLPRR